MNSSYISILRKRILVYDVGSHIKIYLKMSRRAKSKKNSTKDTLSLYKHTKAGYVDIIDIIDIIVHRFRYRPDMFSL